MGFRRRFEFGLAWRTLVLMLAIWLFMHSLSLPDLRAARLVAARVSWEKGDLRGWLARRRTFDRRAVRLARSAETRPCSPSSRTADAP